MSVGSDFKAFVMRGNVVDLAVGVIIGAAFGKIVSSMVDDILMPPIGRALGQVDFSDFFINLGDKGPYRDPGRGKRSRSANTKLRHIPQHGHQFPHRGVLRVYHHPDHSQVDKQACAAGAGDDEGLPAVCDEHSDCGEEVRALHDAVGLTRSAQDTTIVRT